MPDKNETIRAKPFLKWAGGKRAMLPVLRRYFPERFGTYYEPFVGGGAVFFALAPKQAVLSDSNERLVRTYEAVRDHVDQVIDFLARAPNDKTFFKKVRMFKATAADTASVGASTIYLNRTCYNGLWRVNRKGGFNVPFGKYKNPSICDEPNLRACSAALKAATLLSADFEAVLARVRAGDLVYCDPPYLPISATASFTGYTPGGSGCPITAGYATRRGGSKRSARRSSYRTLLRPRSSSSIGTASRSSACARRGQSPAAATVVVRSKS